MYVNRIEDPRGPLQLASRYELYQCAKANGIKEIDEAMYMGPYAAEKMKKILASKGITDLKTVLQPFGSPPGTEQPSGKTMTMDDLIAQTVTPTIDHKVMTRAELAKEVKRRGIKMARTDTKEQLRERLSVAHAS
jgi:hypothetical protein